MAPPFDDPERAPQGRRRQRDQLKRVKGGPTLGGQKPQGLRGETPVEKIGPLFVRDHKFFAQFEEQVNLNAKSMEGKKI